ncbi:MAG: aspartate aminotransferase family protein [Verrucomicrobiota bacterium]
MLPELITQIPGPKSKHLAKELRTYESHNLTYVSEGFPIFWERALGSNVWDVDGNRFLDLNGGFGVATAGFGSSHVVDTFRQQAQELYHGMGDVHPSRLKVELCRELSRITFERWGVGLGKSILGCAGFEAVEAALKTAYMATGRPGVLAFHSGYHGLGYGAMVATGMPGFRKPFADQIRSFSEFLDFPRLGGSLQESEFSKQLEDLHQKTDFGAILVEPIQGRGGEHIPPPWFLPTLRSFADANNLILIFDEIYTGFFRTGHWFACDHWQTIPDIICLGKGLSGSFPISACIGRTEIMDHWPVSEGEALHTSTFLGNPMGCALGLASIRHWSEEDWVTKIKTLHQRWVEALSPLETLSLVNELRGIGLLFGLEFVEKGLAGRLIEPLLQRGIIALPAGEQGDVLSIKPSITHDAEESQFVGATLLEAIEDLRA